MSNKIEIYQGNSFNATVPVYNSIDNTEFDLTGYTGRLMIKKKIDDTTAIIDKELSVVDNKLDLAVLSSETILDPYKYIYEVRITDGTDEKTVIPPTVFEILDTLIIQ